jgi:hypothetical protein
MPKQTTAKGFPCKPEDCFVSRHLDGPEYKIYDLMCACAPFANGKRLFYAPVRPYLVNAANQSGSAVDATLARLEKAGWIIDLGHTRKPDGKLSPTTYRIVEHAEWSATHAGKCPDYKLAPKDDEEYGVQRGQKRSTDLLPVNFRSRHPVLGRAISKVLAEEISVITDEELAAWNKHLASHGEPVEVTTHGQPGAVIAASHGQPEQAAHGQPGEAYHGQPVADLSRSTEKNPIKSILEESPHTHTPDPNGVSVCVSTSSPTMDSEKVIRTLLAMADGWIARKEDKENWKKLLEKMPADLFLAAARQYVADPPSAVNDRTDYKWQFFYDDINRCVRLAKKAAADKVKREAERPEEERKYYLNQRKCAVRIIDYKWKPDFLASLSQEDRDYIQQVQAATTLEELPPDNGKDYDALSLKWSREKFESERGGVLPASIDDF